MKKTILIASVLALSLSSMAVADEFGSGFDVALKGGTLGGGIEVSSMMSRTYGVRANLNGLSYNDNRDAGDLTYDTDIDFLSIGMLGDYYPFQSAFRISAGLYYNNNTVTGHFSPMGGESFQLGDGVYTANEIGGVTTDVEWENTVAPYIGIGWGSNSNNKGFGLTVDIGAMYQGSTLITTTPEINAGVPDYVRAQILADAHRETAVVQKDIEEYTWYPVISIGVSYAF